MKRHKLLIKIIDVAAKLFSLVLCLGGAWVASWMVMWDIQDGYDALPFGSRRWIATRTAYAVLVVSLARFYWLRSVMEMPMLGLKSATDAKDSPAPGEGDKEKEDNTA